MSRNLAGPDCGNCGSNEQDCAWNYGVCCSGCSHWVRYDRHGNERRPDVEHGTQRGYDQHRTRRELPCPACRSAHSRYVGERTRRTA